jgi:hypothetical protein
MGGVAEPLSWPLGVVWPPPKEQNGGGRNYPNSLGGGSAMGWVQPPQTGFGVVEPTSWPMRVIRPPP